jgi:hypothetical protein
MIDNVNSEGELLPGKWIVHLRSLGQHSKSNQWLLSEPVPIFSLYPLEKILLTTSFFGLTKDSSFVLLTQNLNETSSFRGGGGGYANNSLRTNEEV